MWDWKEIENYFLLLEPIVRAISRRMPARTSAPSPDEVSAQLDRICEGLKDETFDAMAAEILADNRALGAGGANKAARQTLNSRWQTLEGKLRTVSGKRVFAELSQWAQGQFGTSLGAAVVARELTEGEIEAELSDVVRAIELDHRFRMP